MIEVWGLSDLHLGPGEGKGHFSSSWKEHQPKIRAAWDERIGRDAMVLMPGDFSWHQNPDDLKYDYYWINDRPGFKVLSPGNHDYGVWSSEKEASGFLQQFDSMRALYGNAIRIENPAGSGPGMVIAATCGTAPPEDQYFNSNGGVSSKDQDKEIDRFFRELKLLKKAIKEAKKLQRPGDSFVMMFHYPPFAEGDQDSVWSRAFEEAGVDLCLYGHLHQTAQWQHMIQGDHGGVEYRFAGADFLGFKPTKLGDFTAEGFQLAPIEVTKPPAVNPSTQGGSTTHYKQHTPTTTSKPAQTTLPIANTTAPTPSTMPGIFHDTTGRKWVEASAWSKSDNGKYLFSDLLLHAGKPQICLECDSLILQGERIHNIDGGVVHGAGSYNQRGTCVLAEVEDENTVDDEKVQPVEPQKIVPIKNICMHCKQPIAPHQQSLFSQAGVRHLHQADCQPVDAVSETSEAATTTTASAVKERTCVACLNPIKEDDEWHTSARGPIHGHGDHNSAASCDTSEEPVTAPSTPRPTCIECQREIFKAEPWHQSEKGPIHGFGGRDVYGTCKKTPAGETSPRATVSRPATAAHQPAATAGVHKPVTPAAKKPAYRASNLTLEEASELDTLAGRYLRGDITFHKLQKLGKPYAQKPQYQSNVYQYGGAAAYYEEGW